MDAHPANGSPTLGRDPGSSGSGALYVAYGHIKRTGTGVGLGRGLVTLYLSLMVMLPLAAVVDSSLSNGLDAFWKSVSGDQAMAALKLTVVCSLIVVAINAVFGTIIAWVLVRDDFRGKAAVNALIDLPFALPTIVAGLTLLTLYGPESPVGLDVAFTRVAIVFALCFITLPFVVRAVQPLLMEIDREMEEAATSLGAGGFTTFRRIIFPNLMPGVIAGVMLAFARALGEYGSVILISGNIPFKTEVSSVFIRTQIETGNVPGASAVSVVLLTLSVLMLVLVSLFARSGAHGEKRGLLVRTVNRVIGRSQVGGDG